jgi:hypothetical protein
LTEGHFVALTEESFYTIDAARIAIGNADLSVEDYQKQAGLKPSWYYWGYPDDNEDEGDGSDRVLQTADDVHEAETVEMPGLTFIKQQLLPRLGESYATLVDYSGYSSWPGLSSSCQFLGHLSPLSLRLLRLQLNWATFACAVPTVGTLIRLL